MVAPAQEILWLRQLLTDIGMKPEKATVLHCDNKSAIALASNDKHHQRTKHINVRHHFIRQLVEEGTILLSWVPSEEQLADILTKPLGPTIFKRIKRKLTR